MIIEKQKQNQFSISKWIDELREIIQIQIKNKITVKDHQNILLGILLGNDEELNSAIKEEFSNSNISHILAVSGMHVSYIIIGISFLFGKLHINPKITKVITILVLILFLFLTQNALSVQRACIMTILSILASLFYRKNSLYNSMAVSLTIILLENPYAIINIGLILSYSATLGIFLFYKKENCNDRKKTQKNIVQKLIEKAIQIIRISFCVQIMIFPLNILYFQKISLTFFISNLLISSLMGSIIFLGFLLAIPVQFPIVSEIIIWILSHLLQMLVSISHFFSGLWISHINMIVPPLILVVFYYICLLFFLLIQSLKKKTLKKNIEKRFYTIVENFQHQIKANKNKIIVYIFFIIFLFSIFSCLPRNLEIHFLDVGQGDCSIIMTPERKKILIDGGGSLNKDGFNIGEKTLLPYLLNHSIGTIDMLMISHFDIDHCRTDY